MDQPPQRTGLRAFARIVRQNAGFRSLVIANAISQIGDWFDIVALIALLYAMTGKAQSVAFVLVTRWLPFFVAGPVAGVVADRMSRRSIMIVCDLLRAALVLAFLLVRNPGDVWIAYLVVILHSTASAFFEPAQSASIPSLVPPSDVYAATAMDNSLWSVSLAIGAVLGGLALRWAGRDAAFCIDAISFLGSAWFLRGLPENAAAAPSLERRSWARRLGILDFVEGVRFVFAAPAIRALLAVRVGFGFLLGGVLVLLTWFGEKVFVLPGGIAILWTARGIGSFAGPLAAWHFLGDSPAALRRGITFALLILWLCYSAFASAPNVWIAVPFLLIANACGSVLWTNDAALLQEIAPDAMRGRVFAAAIGIWTLALSIVTLVIGALLDAEISPRWLMAAVALAPLVTLPVWLRAQRLVALAAVAVPREPRVEPAPPV